MKRITIDGKEYTFEFTIEASLYDECTVSAMEVFVKMGAVRGDDDMEGAIHRIVETMAGTPKRALTLFYAGLLEHHGAAGDGSIKSINDAKALLIKYLKEYGKSFDDVSSEMMETMGEDNFFELIGLNKMLNRLNMATEEEKKPRKRAGASTSEK